MGNEKEVQESQYLGSARPGPTLRGTPHHLIQRQAPSTAAGRGSWPLQPHGRGCK